MTSTEQSPWVTKERNSMEKSALRFVLLGVIKIYSDKGGIYGYAISEAILNITQGELDATNATFYAILRRLEQNRLIYSQLQESADGPPRKHYFISNEGLKAYNFLRMNWTYFSGLIDRVIHESEQ